MPYNKMILTTSAITVIFVTVLQTSFATFPKFEHPNFCYSSDETCGPHNWLNIDTTLNSLTDFVDQLEWESGDGKHDLHNPHINYCAYKGKPSPFNLYANQWCTDGHEILTRKIQRSDCKMEDMKFMITPHSLRVTNPIDDKDCRRQTVDLPNGFGSRFHLQFIDIHLRSEHVIEGERFDAEIMMFHLGTMGHMSRIAVPSVLLDGKGTQGNKDLQLMIDKWQAEADRVDLKCAKRRMMEKGGVWDEQGGSENIGHTVVDKLTLENLLQKSRNNTIKQNITNEVYRPSNWHNKTKYSKRELEEEIPRIKMFPYTMWPTTWYYRYEGSLPYPPCFPKLDWRVFDAPLKVSRRQIKWMSRLVANYVDEETCTKSSAVTKHGEAFRPLLEQDQKVETVHCKPRDFKQMLFPIDEA